MPDKSQIISEMVQNSHLFKTLDEQGQIDLEKTGKKIEVNAGEVIIEEGSDGECFYFVISGKVEVSSLKDGKSVKLAELGHGAVLGEVALITGEPRTATVKAIEPTVLMEFSEPGINTILDDYPKVKELLVRVVVHRAKDTIDKLTKDLSVS